MQKNYISNQFFIKLLILEIYLNILKKKTYSKNNKIKKI